MKNKPDSSGDADGSGLFAKKTAKDEKYLTR